MTATVSTGGNWPNSVANGALKGAAIFWFLVAVIGQWAFVYFILSLYGAATVQGNFDAWNKIFEAQGVANDGIAHGYVAGDTTGNLIFGAHALIAAILTFGATLQLIPQIRSHFPAFHRWNGRVFILSAFAVSIAGLYLIWVRGSTPSIYNALGISLNAALIMIFAALALRYAIARDIDTHRRWALRTFIVINGVWFLRVGFIIWVILNQGQPVGHTDDFKGPFDIFIAFGSYLVPLAILEIYLRTQDRAGATGKWLMAIGLFFLTLAMGAGIAGTVAYMWLPLL